MSARRGGGGGGGGGAKWAPPWKIKIKFPFLFSLYRWPFLRYTSISADNKHVHLLNICNAKDMLTIFIMFSITEYETLQ